MKLNQPVGNSQVGPLLIRLSIGSYFLMAGLGKIDRIPAFVRQVNAFGILPESVGTLYGLLLPYFEVVIGAMLLMGLWTTLAGGIAALMLCSFIIAIGLFPDSSMFFNKDLILLAGVLSLMYTGAGGWSLDGGKK